MIKIALSLQKKKVIVQWPMFLRLFFFLLQVSPTTLRIDLNACSKQKGNKITIRPTIPARLDPVTNSYSRARFILPEKGLKLRIKDRSTNQNCLSTEFKLQGTDPVDVEVVPDCTALEKDTKSTKVIVVKMMPNDKFWQKTFVRTIWVSYFAIKASTFIKV